MWLYTVPWSSPPITHTIIVACMLFKKYMIITATVPEGKYSKHKKYYIKHFTANKWYHLSCLPVQCSRRGFTAWSSVSARNVLLYASSATAFCQSKMPANEITQQLCKFTEGHWLQRMTNNKLKWWILQSNKRLKVTLLICKNCYSYIIQLGSIAYSAYINNKAHLPSSPELSKTTAIHASPF